MNGQTAASALGKFIAFEGIDGAGKSTQIRRLVERLSSIGIKCYETREPTDSPIGSLIHQMMTGRIIADNKVIASMFIADRVDHLLNKTDGILEMVNNGVSVLTDRYYFSSYAYNGVDIDMDWVIQGNAISANILRPTLTVFLDIPVKAAIERIQRERFRTELYETEERLIAVRAKYFEAFEKLEGVENVAIVDAEADTATVQKRIWDVVSGFFGYSGIP
ncbi:MAG: dTMP kinase [Oscillospiraceae bacterium]|jgi:dTMP kinase|nr:dTMP kinase [Oscillospiraceae bacterium]